MAPIGSLIIISSAIIATMLLNASLTRAEPLSFIQDLRGRGLDIGGGLSVHLDTLPAPANASLLERHALRVDYDGMGLQVGMDAEENAYKVGLIWRNGEARDKDKKVSEFLIPALLGYKTSALIILILFGAAVFVVKTLVVAKMAIMIAAGLWAKRLFGGEKKIPMEFDVHPSQLHPVYAEYPGDISELGYTQTADGNFVAFAAPYQGDGGNEIAANEIAESSAEEAASSQQYTFAEAPSPSNNNPSGNATSTPNRRSTLISRPQAIHTYITVKRKTVRH